MPTLEPTLIRQVLEHALSLTQQALATIPAEAELLVLLDERGVLLDRAETARLAGAPWGHEEAALARSIVATDEKLLAALARANADGLAWLTSRDETALKSLPCLAALCHPTLVPEGLVPASAPLRPALSRAAARYSKTVLALL